MYPKPQHKIKKRSWIIRKAIKKKRRIKRIRLPSLKSLRDRADAVFSVFIRTRDGYKCVLCGSTTNIQCGHLIKRGKLATRYNEVNCSALCSKCNWRDNFDHDIYVIFFLNKYGQEKYHEIFELSRRTIKYSRLDFQVVIDKYKQVS